MIQARTICKKRRSYDFKSQLNLKHRCAKGRFHAVVAVLPLRIMMICISNRNTMKLNFGDIVSIHLFPTFYFFICACMYKLLQSQHVKMCLELTVRSRVKSDAIISHAMQCDLFAFGFLLG